VKKKGY